VLIYFGLCVVATFVAALLLHLTGKAPILAAAHLVFALGILPLIFSAIAYFVPVLTRSGRAQRAVLIAPVLLQMAGLSTFLYLDGKLERGFVHAAAGLVLLVAMFFSGWLVQRAARTLGKPHPGGAWYLMAVALLSVAMAAVPAMSLWPDAYRALRLLHLHLNTLGFVGMTAIGTLQVLFPTALRTADAEAASRLRRHLVPFAGAVLAIGLGAGWSRPLALGGALILLYFVLSLGLAWIRRYSLPVIVGGGAALPLAAALTGYTFIIGLGAAHALQALAGQDAVFAFIALFLLPLVSGALSQLLPVWRWPGPDSLMREKMRLALARGGGVRSMLFLGGGLAIALGETRGVWLVATGLGLFVVGLLNAFRFAADHGAKV
jgi:hypothetical protein